MLIEIAPYSLLQFERKSLSWLEIYWSIKNLYYPGWVNLVNEQGVDSAQCY